MVIGSSDWWVVIGSCDLVGGGGKKRVRGVSVVNQWHSHR